MSSSRIDTNVSFVKIEIGTSEPSVVRIDKGGSPYVLGTNADSDMKFSDMKFNGEYVSDYVSQKHATIENVKGKVSLVGAGPGDPELITAKGVRVIQHADVILHDALIHPHLIQTQFFLIICTPLKV